MTKLTSEQVVAAMTGAAVDTVDTKLSKMTHKSEKIRFLHSLGWKTSAICKKIKYEDGRDLRPQHVHNTLSQQLKKQ